MTVKNNCDANGHKWTIKLDEWEEIERRGFVNCNVCGLPLSLDDIGDGLMEDALMARTKNAQFVN